MTTFAQRRTAYKVNIHTGSEGTDVESFVARFVAKRLNVIVSVGISTGKTALRRKLLELVAPD